MKFAAKIVLMLLNRLFLKQGIHARAYRKNGLILGWLVCFPGVDEVLIAAHKSVKIQPPANATLIDSVAIWVCTRESIPAECATWTTYGVPFPLPDPMSEVMRLYSLVATPDLADAYDLLYKVTTTFVPTTAEQSALMAAILAWIAKYPRA